MTKEKILKIYEVEDVEGPSNSYVKMDGFVIETSKQKIEFLIENSQHCCESWGYMVSEDDLSDFIGAEILDIKNVDTSSRVLGGILSDPYLSFDDCVFINVETNRGTLQFVLYNEHNGYYGHAYRIRSSQHSEDGGL